MLEIIERWQRTGLLRLVEDEQIADMAYMLENQLLYNERASDRLSCNMPQFKRISLPLARRIFPNLNAHQDYKVESKVGLESSLQFYLGLNGVWSSDGRDHDFDEEAEQTAQLAEEAKCLIDRFIETQAPFNTFYVQAFGLDEENKLTLHYDID